MCRWLAYSGTPILIEHLLYEGHHSLIDQSLHSKLGAETTNGDGFGLGWYGEGNEAGVFHSVEPAWNDQNLRELAAHVRSPLVFAHIRASSGAPVQQTNCHPFRHGQFLWMHNGLVHDFHRIKRELVFEVAPELFPAIAGTTDSETLFFLALGFGLENDPPTAVARTIGLVEDVGRRNGIEHPFQGTIATTDGTRVWAFRYSSIGDSRSLYFSSSVEILRALYPGVERLAEFGEESRMVVSEPLGDLPGVWNEVPEATYGVIQPGQDELHAFAPLAPA
jgi:predicted glutamine amidotransferase